MNLALTAILIVAGFLILTKILLVAVHAVLRSSADKSQGAAKDPAMLTAPPLARS